MSSNQQRYSSTRTELTDKTITEFLKEFDPKSIKDLHSEIKLLNTKIELLNKNSVPATNTNSDIKASVDTILNQFPNILTNFSKELLTGIERYYS